MHNAHRPTRKNLSLPLAIAAASLLLASNLALAEGSHSSKLLLTGGVSQLEGAAGGGLTPWAVIGGYGTDDEIGASLHYSYADAQDFALSTEGLTVGLYDRVELSLAEQRFNVSDLNSALGGLLGTSDIKQTILGAKVRLAGEAVLDQDTWMPQIAAGVQYKKNQEEKLVKFLGAKDDAGVDYYLSATKLFIGQSLLVNGTLRMTKANQLGLLGFGSEDNNSYKPQLEFSTAYLLSRDLTVGAEYRMKPDNLDKSNLPNGTLAEDDWWDVFIAYAPTKNVSLTAAYVNLGNVVDGSKLGLNGFSDQQATYLSVQLGF
jgi:hypothetical protein